MIPKTTTLRFIQTSGRLLLLCFCLAAAAAAAAAVAAAAAAAAAARGNERRFTSSQLESQQTLGVVSCRQIPTKSLASIARRPDR
ncbi:hypothetical protein EYF80_038058 [Liparis tanakae]|uniref:Secreted protein n=1 Tax=Liparis tanakae TaxID=230148 RepID=A0A4Z2GDX7_9TELE|nr:hypothetical protein EYF80_038058 [Liparis tanakae]